MKKKLSLNKITVSNLNNKDLSKANGGGTFTCVTNPNICPNHYSLYVPHCPSMQCPAFTAECPVTDITGCNIDDIC